MNTNSFPSISLRVLERIIGTNKIIFCFIFLYHESDRLHTEHTFIHAIKGEKHRKDRLR